MNELFKLYGIASIFAAVRKLHEENRELKEQLREHKNIVPFIQTQPVTILPSETKVDVAETKKPEDNTYGKTAVPFSTHLTTKELVKKAKDEYESSVTISSKKAEELKAKAAKVMENDG